MFGAITPRFGGAPVAPPASQVRCLMGSIADSLVSVARDVRSAVPRRAAETIIGALVVIAAAFVIVYAYSGSGVTVAGGYIVTAVFDRVEGIRVGSEVRLSGIKVGSVAAEKLDPDTYSAVLTLSIAANLNLPADTSAKIMTDGLVGSRYVALQPGAEEKFLEPGGRIMHTQSTIDIGDLISRYVFKGSESRGDADKNKGSNTGE